MEHYVKIEGKGVPIVFIHGAFLNSSSWKSQSRYFRYTNKVLLYDLRGHGYTGPSDIDSYSSDIYTTDLIRLLDQESIPKAIFCGLSLGAMIAQRLASQYPDRVEGLILCGAPASMALTIPEKVVIHTFFSRFFAKALFHMLDVRSFIRISFFLTWSVIGKKWLGNAKTRWQIKQAMSRIQKKEWGKIYDAVHGFRLQDLSRITSPVLILSGQHDAIVIHKHGRYLQKHLANSSFHLVSNAGHACNLDNPAHFNQLVEEWLHKIGAHSPYPCVNKYPEAKVA